MTAVNTDISVAYTGRHVRAAAPEPEQAQPQKHNVGSSERAVSIAAGAILAAIGIARKSGPGIATAAVGGLLLLRGMTGKCMMYKALGINTAEEEEAGQDLAERGIHVEHTFLINRTPAELYQYWRNFENLPAIMSHLKQVRVIDQQRSHWTAKAPRIAGGSVEWEAEIVRDDPNQCIAWRSLPGADVDNADEVRFSTAPADRGTEVHVRMSYLPPAGRVGHWLAKLFGSDATNQIREDLRRFKRMMEVGEVPTIDGQSRGTCTGRGLSA